MRLTFRKGHASNLFWTTADGCGAEERLTTSPYLQRPGSWSPDGRVLVYSENDSSGSEDIWLLDLADESKPRPFLQTPFRELQGILSPDGRWIAYMSDESGQFEVYVQSFPGPGGKWQISNEGGRQIAWARSGREIFYRNGDKMMAVAVDTEPSFRAGKPVVLFEGKFSNPAMTLAQYDVAPNDEEFVMIQDVESWPTQIHVVLNWFEELKARPKR